MVLDEAVFEPMVRSSATLPHGVDELEGSGLSYVDSKVVAPPRIAEAPAALECREHSTLRIGQNRLVVGEVLPVWARDGRRRRVGSPQSTGAGAGTRFRSGFRSGSGALGALSLSSSFVLCALKLRAIGCFAHDARAFSPMSSASFPLRLFSRGNRRRDRRFGGVQSDGPAQ